VFTCDLCSPRRPAVHIPDGELERPDDLSGPCGRPRWVAYIAQTEFPQWCPPPPGCARGFRAEVRTIHFAGCRPESAPRTSRFEASTGASCQIPYESNYPFPVMPTVSVIRRRRWRPAPPPLLDLVADAAERTWVVFERCHVRHADAVHDEVPPRVRRHRGPPRCGTGGRSVPACPGAALLRWTAVADTRGGAARCAVDVTLVRRRWRVLGFGEPWRRDRLPRAGRRHVRDLSSGASLIGYQRIRAQAMVVGARRPERPRELEVASDRARAHAVM
jgi:hypothetical protein